jgi:hypothetical protein
MTLRRLCAIVAVVCLYMFNAMNSQMTLQHNTVQYNTVPLPYNAIQYKQCNAMQYNSIQYNTPTANAEFPQCSKNSMRGPYRFVLLIKVNHVMLNIY